MQFILKCMQLVPLINIYKYIFRIPCHTFIYLFITQPNEIPLEFPIVSKMYPVKSEPHLESGFRMHRYTIRIRILMRTQSESEFDCCCLL